jgi:predicted ATPase
MFTNIRVKNFKAWGDQLWAEGLELAPITLLLGVNSAGKSSLLQPLRLWQQTLASSDPDMELNLGNTDTDGLHLGTFQDTIHGHDASGIMGIGVSVERSGSSASAAVTYKLNSKSRIVVDTLAISRGQQERWTATRQGKGGYTLDWPGASQNQVRSTKAFEPQRSIFLPPEALGAFGSTQRGFGEVTNHVAKQFRTLSYLGPMRAAPKRFEQWNQQRPGTLGHDGRWTIQALLASATNGDEHGLVEHVGSWMKHLGLVEDMRVKQFTGSPLHQVLVERGGITSNLLDVGFGVSQVLPVVTLAHFAARGSTVILEEPEMHLHPLAQANLADMFVDAAGARGVQFLIETHSEHLFRRMQYLVAAGGIDTNRVRMYFIERDASGATVPRRLEMDTYGRVRNWPKHFFGDAVGETERHMSKVFELLSKEVSDAG